MPVCAIGEHNALELVLVVGVVRRVDVAAGLHERAQAEAAARRNALEEAQQLLRREELRTKQQVHRKLDVWRKEVG